jgi:transcriptional regulator GlxA family with amidase domain
VPPRSGHWPRGGTACELRGTADQLAALADPVVGPALAVLYTQPERDWTVASLAAATGVSRVTLARRFPVTVGDTPAAHLTHWRMDLAAQWLRDCDDSDDSVAAISRTAGYASEYAFSRAFTRVRGIPPGRYRASSRPAERDRDEHARGQVKHVGRGAPATNL